MLLVQWCLWNSFKLEMSEELPGRINTSRSVSDSMSCQGSIIMSLCVVRGLWSGATWGMCIETQQWALAVVECITVNKPICISKDNYYWREQVIMQSSSMQRSPLGWLFWTVGTKCSLSPISMTQNGPSFLSVHSQVKNEKKKSSQSASESMYCYPLLQCSTGCMWNTSGLKYPAIGSCEVKENTSVIRRV